MPVNINSQLREYQRQGVKFLFRQYAQGQGGILGDDMVSHVLPCSLAVLYSKRVELRDLHQSLSAAPAVGGAG